MTFTDDNNPKTKDLTEKLINCTVRFLYSDGHYDMPINHNYSGNRAGHPYMKIDRTKLKQVIILNPDGTERSPAIDIPAGKTVAYRLRTQASIEGVMKVVIVGVVNKTSQVLHYIWRDGKYEIIDTPDEFALKGKLNLMPEERI